jgi:quercetin dioxygenase-like cupin family protein
MKSLLWILVVLTLTSLSAHAQVPGSKCKPIAERNVDGCWILASVPVGDLPNKPLFWHLDVYPSKEAADKAKSENGTVVGSLGRIWLLTLGEKQLRPPKAKHIATIGPIPFDASKKLTAQYMEAEMAPGWQTEAHRHPGPEVWYTEQGDTCLETPKGKQVSSKGKPVIVPEGEPMRLTVIGKEKRRSLVMVLHDSAKPWAAMIHDWTPKNLCR